MEIQEQRSYLVVVNRRDNQCFIIDIAVPNESGIFEKEKEKTEKYQDLRREHKDVGGTNSGWCVRHSNKQPRKTSEDDWCHSNSRTLTKGSITQNSKDSKESLEA